MKPTPPRKIDKHGYEELENGDVFSLDPKKEMFVQACCSCGLVHVIDFKVRKNTLLIKVRVDDKETKKLRGK